MDEFLFEVMLDAHICLSSADEYLCGTYLPKFFQTTVECMQNGHFSLGEPAEGVLTRLIDFCIPSPEELTEETTAHWLKSFQECLKSLCGTLSLQSYAIWPRTLKIFGVLMKKMGGNAAKCECFGKFLETMGELRETGQMMDKNLLESAVGSAVENVGVESVRVQGDVM